MPVFNIKKEISSPFSFSPHTTMQAVIVVALVYLFISFISGGIDTLPNCGFYTASDGSEYNLTGLTKYEFEISNIVNTLFIISFI